MNRIDILDGNFRSKEPIGGVLRKKATIAVGLSLFALTGFGSAAHAQDGATDQGAKRKSEVFGETIVVTAQKRGQNLQDVGISITAYSGDQLSALGFNDSFAIVTQTPGLQVSGTAAGVVGTFSIRGVTQNDFSAAQEGPVAVYVDEAYISQNFVTNFSLFDIDRVEVLRGPQGTLFGRNATGGLVHYVTRRPTKDLDGYFEVELGEDGRRRIGGALGGGLSDAVSARISFQTNKRDGLIYNDIGRDLLDVEDYAIRGQLLFEPSSDLNILLKAQYANEDDAKGGFTKRLARPNRTFTTDPNATDIFGNGQDPDNDPFTVSYDFDAFNTVEMVDLSGHINWTIGDVTLTSITNYQDIKHGFGEDVDASPVSGFNFAQFEDVQQFSQELRVSFEGERLKGVVGAFYLDISGDYNTAQSGDAFFGPGGLYLLDALQETTTFAIFGQAEFAITEELALTAGARLNIDKKDFAFFEAGAQRFSDGFKDTDWSGKLQLDYKPNSDLLIYAGVNRGIKSGGYNQPFIVPSDLSLFAYDGEVLTAYEAGVKATLSDGLRINAATFYYDYDGYQVFTFDGVAVRLFNANAKNVGAELELIATPFEGLDLVLGGSWLDAEVRDLPAANFANGRTTPALAPEFSLNGLIRYSWPIFNGDLAVQLDASWRDDQKFDINNNDIVTEGAYAIANARVTYTGNNNAWSASIFVNNITGTDYRTYGIDLANLGFGLDVLGLERWAGANVKINF